MADPRVLHARHLRGLRCRGADVPGDAERGRSARDRTGSSRTRSCATLRLEPEVFPNAAMLQQDRNLGLLRVSRVDGDVDGDGVFDRVYRARRPLVRDLDRRGRAGVRQRRRSGADLAEAVPSCFNCARRQHRLRRAAATIAGPSPRRWHSAAIEGRDYAFIAPERIGGLSVYDITDPRAPVFQQYVNFRDFSVDPRQVCEGKRPVSEACAAAGDLEPEGVLFIAAADSPIDVPLVVRHPRAQHQRHDLPGHTGSSAPVRLRRQLDRGSGRPAAPRRRPARSP